MMNAIELKLCDIQGRLFENSVDAGFASEHFIIAFMKSKVAEGLDSVYNRMQWAGEEYLLEELNAEQGPLPTGKTYSREVMYWVGYLYRYWAIIRKIASGKIIRQASPKTMNRNYLLFHTMDPELAVEELEELYRQKKCHEGRLKNVN